MPSLFNRLAPAAADPLHAIMARYSADNRPTKIDLGVGVYRDENGHSGVMKAVKNAEGIILNSETSKAYISPRGNPVFLDGMARLLFGPTGMADNITSLQCVGGTGAIWAALILARQAHPDLTVHIGLPSWPNHVSIAQNLGIKIQTHTYFDKSSQCLTIDQIMTALKTVKAGDIVIIHGPCHNPTGADLSREQRDAVLSLCAERGAVPLIDAAYYGLGNSIEDDLDDLRSVFDICPEALLVMSCSKAFGLYRERTGILFAKCDRVKSAETVAGQLTTLARATYSMAPSHGAAVVGEILRDSELENIWRQELLSMRNRLISVRAKLESHKEHVPALADVTSQKGIFSLLPLEREQVNLLAQNAAIYMPSSGRINIAGFKTGDEDLFAEALAKFV